jgi:hypothetical protein
MRRLYLIHILIICLLVNVSLSCKCKQFSLYDVYNKVKFVFTGRVLSVSRVSDKNRALFRISKIYKGLDQSLVFVRTGLDAAACGVNFVVGKEYMIFGYKNADGQVETNVCAKSQLSSTSLLGQVKTISQPKTFQQF